MFVNIGTIQDPKAFALCIELTNLFLPSAAWRTQIHMSRLYFLQGLAENASGIGGNFLSGRGMAENLKDVNPLTFGTLNKGDLPSKSPAGG